MVFSMNLLYEMILCIHIASYDFYEENSKLHFANISILSQNIHKIMYHMISCHQIKF